MEKDFFYNKTISIVCNGDSLLKTDYSLEIDNSDIVIRFNLGGLFFHNFPTLGKKMDIFGVNSYDGEDHQQLIDFLKKIDKSIKVLSTRPLEKGLNYGLFAREIFINTFNEIDNQIFDIKKEVFLNSAIGDYYNFTSGFSTILYVSQFEPRKIKVFGFDAFNNDNDYFFKKKKVFNKGGHNTELESNMISKIHNINIYK